MTLSENARQRATAALGQMLDQGSEAYQHALKYRPKSALESLGRAEARLAMAKSELLQVIKATELEEKRK